MTTTTTTTDARPVEIGDVFVCSWGYDQTNVDTFVVVEVSPSGKTVKTLPGLVEHDDPYAASVRVLPTRTPCAGLAHLSIDYCTEDLDEDGVGQPKSHRVTRSSWDGSQRITVSSYPGGLKKSAYLWDGERTFYQTGFGWGH